MPCTRSSLVSLPLGGCAVKMSIQQRCLASCRPLIGQKEPEIVLGKGSGADSVLYWLRKIGMDATPEQALDIAMLVKEKAMEKKGLVNEDEFRQIATEYLAAAK
jgi:isopropylmalate/homocitrate/citramalate synthase